MRIVTEQHRPRDRVKVRREPRRAGREGSPSAGADAGNEFIVGSATRCWERSARARSSAWIDGTGRIRAALPVSRRGTLESEEDIFRTNVPKVFVSGDVRTGSATVVEAIGEARRASYAMDYWLRGHDLDDPQVRRW